MSSVERPRIEIEKDGAIVARDVPLLTDSRDKPIPVSKKVRLCRSGKSGLKPFCDNTQQTTGFTDAPSDDRVPDWWGSEGATLEVIEMDVRPGCKWRFVEVDTKGKKSTFHGEYQEGEPPRRIVTTLCYGASAASKLFSVRETYEFIPVGTGTLLRLTSSYPMRAALNGMLSVGMDSPGDHIEGSRHQWRLDRLDVVVKA